MIEIKRGRSVKMTKEEFENAMHEILNDEDFMKDLVMMKEISLRLGVNYDTFTGYCKRYDRMDLFWNLKDFIEVKLMKGATLDIYNVRAVETNLRHNYGYKQQIETTIIDANVELENKLNELSVDELKRLADNENNGSSESDM